MKVVVTGGAGFIGSHLCDKLIEQGHFVTALDSLITSTGENIKHLEGNPNFKFIKTDICDSLPEGLEAEAVFHLASPASPHPSNPLSYQQLPFETMRVNTQGTWIMAELALKKGAKFLFASTSEVYGDPLEHPQKESYRGNVSTTGPRSVYDESKRFGETITEAFIRERGLDARFVRIFNTYGPRMSDDGRVLTEFLKAALQNKPIPVFGSGDQTRSFCFISDMVEGIALAMDKENTKGGIFNLGNPTELTILGLAQKVKELTGSSSDITHPRELPEDDPQKRCPDITKAREVLGWEPKISVDEGIKLYASYLEKLVG